MFVLSPTLGSSGSHPKHGTSSSSWATTRRRVGHQTKELEETSSFEFPRHNFSTVLPSTTSKNAHCVRVQDLGDRAASCPSPAEAGTHHSATRETFLATNALRMHFSLSPSAPAASSPSSRASPPSPLRPRRASRPPWASALLEGLRPPWASALLGRFPPAPAPPSIPCSRGIDGGVFLQN